MKTHLISKLISLALVCGAFGQRAVMVNSNNGIVVYPTNLWTANASAVRTGLGLSSSATNPVTQVINGGTGATNAAGARTNLSLGWTALTNSNPSTTLLGYKTNGEIVDTYGYWDGDGISFSKFLTFTNIIKATVLGWASSAAALVDSDGIGLTNVVMSFNSAEDPQWVVAVPQGFRSAIDLSANWLTNTNVINFRSSIGFSTNLTSLWTASSAGSARGSIGLGATWLTNTSASQFRSDIGLPLEALTNTSNVTVMRALSGSTNTNHPYSGSISVVGTNNTNTLVFSNGILQSIQ